MSQPIQPKLEAVFTNFSKNAPESVQKTLNETRQGLITSFNKDDLPKVGTQLPDFSLLDSEGKTVTLQDILQDPETKKGVLITFYRGGWCPFCSIALHGLSKHSLEFEKAGVKLIAISPELPDRVLTTKEKNEVKFTVLTDKGTKYAKQLGITWKMPESVIQVSLKFGNDYKDINGNDERTLPFPTNILIDKQGKIINFYSNPDWTERLEPNTVVEWTKAL